MVFNLLKQFKLLNRNQSSNVLTFTCQNDRLLAIGYFINDIGFNG